MVFKKYQDPSLSPKERAEDLLARMTLREKIGQLNQCLFGAWCYTFQNGQAVLNDDFKKEVEWSRGLGMIYALYRADPWSGRNFSNGLQGTGALHFYNEMQRYVIEHSRFGIPMLITTECPHGHQALNGYLLPVNLAMGAAWNPDVIEDGFRVAGQQISEMGVDIALMSMLDVLRDPRWGRSEECYSEDPYLCACSAAAATRGCVSAGVDVMAKHLAAQGETTGGVNGSAASIGERELREIHLPPMAAAAKAGAHAVMAAYNEIDGIPCHANKWLLNDVLRGEMGFEGIVTADAGAIGRIGLMTEEDNTKSCAEALRAGVDMNLLDQTYHCIEQALERGLVTEAMIDDSALRVLEMKFRRGLFEHPYIEEKPLTEFTCAKYPQSLEIARQSAVLLKNENSILPIGENAALRIAVIGPNADDYYNQLGDYTPEQKPESCVTPLMGIQKIFKNADIRYAAGCSVLEGNDEEIAQAAQLAAESDLVILVIGSSSSRFSGAELDRSNGAAVVGSSRLQMNCGEGVDVSRLELPEVQMQLSKAVFAAGKPVVSVIISGRPQAIPQIAESSSALLWCFYPGPWGGTAIAEVLSGRVNPSGCMPASVPRTTGQIPVYYNARCSYKKMVYADAAPDALYPFGFGMHYTDFKVSAGAVPESFSAEKLRSGSVISVPCTVKNTGPRDGAAVLQLYIRAFGGSVMRRVRELKGYRKIFLRAGEEASLSMPLDFNRLANWTRDHKFDMETGSVQIMIEESGTPCCEFTVRITD